MTRNAVATACAECPLRDFEVFKERSHSEVAFIQQLKDGERTAAAGTAIVTEGVHNDSLFTVLSGWVFHYRTLDGSRRQIINYGLPGDFLGLQATLDDVTSHGIEALTDVTLCHFDRSKLWSLYADHPRLAYDMTWIAARQERSFEEQLLTLGQRTAFERIAYLLWHLFDRARTVGLVIDNTVHLPIRQQHIADTLGLSLVHTNKTLQKIREDRAIEIQDRALRVLDEARLVRLGRVDTTLSSKRPLI
ncbi:cAMP-binding domain of CRP or a regulatory subunit of cAMP-dependent protein kinases [Beijerinckiaceae bacterium RH AL1]|jgi:CRP/FNR family transcriptional regulator, anaerobic regulatory protein|nr:Crp/Fnr family transcriptional regulator [Beijerinckiaceae bacterium]VVB45610.1 cAMP-binding domain of CRP or a regulatory subunit of cAMP-dependent protein kinases [Beijerinckiaceae bacterium RH CH11]VVB45685.1 cAMP-binding domain of CRP or a regulatory subunit of cAMP-dependent protein kinases [Beijerinckiaceae bacterium RH AL8]VVC54951.1 cAMP-binding domain of CRP or a regulatory subunit of cAMP-dependent protein kinases [Beijerinckiaceae bacterium RH AL1]